MFLSSLPFPLFGNPLSDWFARAVRKRPPKPDTIQSQRWRKEFIDDMLTRSPDAFSSAHDIEAAMLMFPDRF